MYISPQTFLDADGDGFTDECLQWHDVGVVSVTGDIWERIRGEKMKHLSKIQVKNLLKHGKPDLEDMQAILVHLLERIEKLEKGSVEPVVISDIQPQEDQGYDTDT